MFEEAHLIFVSQVGPYAVINGFSFERLISSGLPMLGCIKLVKYISYILKKFKSCYLQ